MATDKPKALTIRGRLSFPNFTYEQALRQNKKSDYPKADEKVRPNFNMLLTQVQQDKLIAYIKDEFLPWVEEQEKAYPKASDKSGLSAANIKKITRALDEADWEVDKILGLLGPVPERTVDLAPEAVSSLRVTGFPRQDLTQKVLVTDLDQLKNPVDVVLPARGEFYPQEDTKVELYPGCHVAAQLDMWAFTAVGNPGITATTPAVLFIADGERFGGGGGIDEEDVFMDLDEE